MTTATTILNGYYFAIIALAVAAVAGYWVRETARTWGMHWRDGEACPHCGKPLELGRGSSLLTFGRPVAWLRCSGWPKCDFSTRRVAAYPEPANENARRASPPGVLSRR